MSVPTYIHNNNNNNHETFHEMTCQTARQTVNVRTAITTDMMDTCIDFSGEKLA